MAKVIYCDNKYKILKCRRGYVLVNRRGSYENHAHFNDRDACFKLIRILKKRSLPNSKYYLEAARRVVTEESYKQAITNKQRKTKQRYIINKGCR